LLKKIATQAGGAAPDIGVGELIGDHRSPAVSAKLYGNRLCHEVASIITNSFRMRVSIPEAKRGGKWGRRMKDERTHASVRRIES
jgi:hypothetical protein